MIAEYACKLGVCGERRVLYAAKKQQEKPCSPKGSFFLGPAGLREDFLRLPMAVEEREGGRSRVSIAAT
jgi:hypothetical protein